MPLLPSALHWPMAGVGVVCSLAVAALGLHYAGQSGPGRLDRWALPALWHSAYVGRRFALFLDSLGQPVGATVVFTSLLGICVLLGGRRMTVLAVAGPAATIAVTTLVKHLVRRTIHGGWLSYPSGHVAYLTDVAIVLALLAIRRIQSGWLARTLVILTAAGVAGGVMTWSQAGLYAHYLTDTVGGFCTAVAVVPSTAWLIDRIADRHTPFGPTLPSHGRSSPLRHLWAVSHRRFLASLLRRDRQVPLPERPVCRPCVR
jgi:undecaprenyl-diphosphatase